MPPSRSLLGGRPDGHAEPPQGAGGWASAPLRIVREDPSAIPALGAIALLVAWAADQDGFPQTHWAPGGLILLALLAIAIGAGGLSIEAIPPPVRLAIGALAAYTAFSFLSILWAKAPGEAWEGADRTFLYLIIFALFAGFQRSGRSAALLLCTWVLAMAGLAVYTVAHIDAAAASVPSLQALMPGGRLVFPAGYANANAAMWMMAFFVAWLLASARRLPTPLRGLLAGSAVVLACAALYSQSRGAVYSIPIMLLLVFALLPGRVRNLLWLLPIGLGVGACTPAILHLDKHLESGWAPASVVHSATLPVLLSAAVVTILGTAIARFESRLPASQRTRERTRRAIGIVSVLGAILAIVALAAAIGRPIGRVEHAWNTFTSIKGYGANSAGQSRLVGGFGSNRYDFYRVAWHEFVEHPLIGIGVDNFAEEYLRLGHSLETPHYPHSVELRTLLETGLLGAIFVLAGLIGSVLALRRALRRTDPLAKALAAAALAGFAYWAVHGSFDWFFEYAGLGACAFALLGLGCSLTAPRPPRARAESPAALDPDPRPRDRPLTRGRRMVLGAGMLAIILAGGLSLGLPWLSRMEVESAAKAWTQRPSSAYAQLHQAAEINPLSAEPNLIAGTIALRLRQLDRARVEFERAVSRLPGNAYATLELGAIASSRGHAEEALRLLERAAFLSPRNELTKQALETARKGERVDVEALNRSILREAEQFS
jgi:O-antigen ligase